MQQELRVRQLEHALGESVGPDQDEPMPVLLGVVMGSEEDVDRGAVKEGDLSQIQRDRLDIGSFEMRQVILQEWGRSHIKLTHNGYLRDPITNLDVHRTLLLEHGARPSHSAALERLSRPWIRARTSEPWTEARL